MEKVAFDNLYLLIQTSPRDGFHFSTNLVLTIELIK